MFTPRLRERVPSAVPIAIGKLKGHVLRWDKRSQTDGSGKCDAEVTGRARDFVWGVVFALKAREKIALDRAEGLGSGYSEKQVDIATGKLVIKAVTYVATDKKPSLKPYHWYKAFVVTGARDHELPRHYIRRLNATKSIRDPDRARSARNEKLLSTC
jgi:hypothetical protein